MLYIITAWYNFLCILIFTETSRLHEPQVVEGWAGQDRPPRPGPGHRALPRHQGIRQTKR